MPPKKTTSKSSSSLLFQINNKDPLHLHPTISKHAASPYSQSVRLVSQGNGTSKFSFSHAGATHVTGGVHGYLKAKYYPHYIRNRSQRRHHAVKVKGSDAAKGKTVDRQIGRWVATNNPKVVKNVLARAIVDYLVEAGHLPQAAQLPCKVVNAFPPRMTQADLITMDAYGKVCLWEVKSGFPVGGFRKQGHFEGGVKDYKGNPVPCTEYNIWQLQLHHTRQGLERAGVHIDQAHIIQAYIEKGKVGVQLKIHDQCEWVKRL